MKIALSIFSSASMLMHLYPFWIILVFGLKNPGGYWRGRPVEIFANIASALLVCFINYRIVRRHVIVYLGAIVFLNALNIFQGLQVYGIMALVVDVWSMTSIHFLRKKYGRAFTR